MRDDFNRSVKDVLSKRVGLHCSNPNCRALTIGPNSIENKTVNIGVAAHITAASPNGPRYDYELTSQERCSIDNAIWLCQTCAKIIDSDPDKYSTELIRKWKEEAEKETEIELTRQKKNLLPPSYDGLFECMPELINELIEDVKSNLLLREFILLKKGWSYNSGNTQILVYYYDDHENLDEKIKLLENNELVTDITYNNTKRYVLSESFVKILKEHEKMDINKA